MLALLILAQALAPTPAAMDVAKTVCPAMPAALPADYAGWSVAAPVTAAPDASRVGDAMLRIGQGARATLQPASALRLPVPSARPLGATGHGGVFAFEAAAAGRYRVALGAGVWVDVVANGAALTSVAHGHGPDCTPVRKYVDFDLKPGRYLLQVTGDPSVLALMVAKLG
ncbi:homogentisate 1,2-dioxygenase [uncultured Sphingomonas sp.]|uniref:homogentisate 1,2-dioxygenase n=1 Tax=uncultured Sphingomonas sp. TaxID=158754 RepID=UPI0035CA1B66